MFNIDRNTLQDKIMYTSLVIFPLLSLLWNQILTYEYNKYFYDLIYLFSFIAGIFKLVFEKTGKVRQENFILIVFLSLLFLIMTLRAFSAYGAQEFFPVIYMMESKPFIYTLLLLPLLLSKDSIRIESLEKYIHCFSIIFIVNFILDYSVDGFIWRPSIMSEANYDGVVIILGFILHLNIKDNMGENLDVRKLLIYTLATFATLSKTGILCFSAIIFLYSNKKLNATYFIVSLISALFVAQVFITKISSVGGESVFSLDRFVMWDAFINIVRNNTSYLFFGNTTGIPIEYLDNKMDWYIQFQGEKLGVTGLHPYNFHSMFLRVIFDHGLFSTLALSFLFYRVLRYTKAQKYLYIIIILFGFSLGLFYLSTVLLFFIFTVKTLVESNLRE